MIVRPLTAEERSLVRRIADRLGGDEGAQLRADLENATARAVIADGSIVEFDISGYERPAWRGQHPFRVEGTMVDRDGAELEVVLHADENGRLLELEIIRYDPGDLIAPDWSTLELEPPTSALENAS